MRAGWRWLGVAVVAIAVASPAAATEISYVYLPVDVPGATYTHAWGINDRADVVGMYRDPAGVMRGFVLRSGAFETITFPGASITQVRGINSVGQIIGSYRLPGESSVAFHGFVRQKDGSIEPVDYPNAPHTIAQRILADGTSVGCFHGADLMESMFGFVRTPDGAFSEFSVPASMHNGATQGGKQVVGTYTDHEAGISYGYVFQDGEVSPFLVPGSEWTEAWDINPRGDIVGNYGGETLATMRGYLLRGGEFSTVHVPGAVATFALGVNAWGAIVGRYVDTSGRNHGYVAVPRVIPSMDPTE